MQTYERFFLPFVPLRHLILPIVAVIAFCGFSVDAIAQDNLTAAARAFSQGQAAELKKDYRQAAQFYELADGMVPSLESLRSAVRNRYAAKDYPMAASRAKLLLHRYPKDKLSRKLAKDILDELTPKLGRIVVFCESECTLSVDGYVISIDAELKHEFFVKPGEHEFLAEYEDGRSRHRFAFARSGKGKILNLDADPLKPKAVAQANPGLSTSNVSAVGKESQSTGVSRKWVLVGSVVTVVVGGVAIWSGMDVLDNHERYKKGPTNDGYQDGLDRQRRTNYLLGATALAATTTVVIGYFTNWSNKESRGNQFAVSPMAKGATLSFGGTF